MSSNRSASLRGVNWGGSEGRLAAVAAGDAAVLGGAGDGGGDGAHDALLEDAGDDVILGEVIVGDDVGDGAGGGQLHRLVDLAGADVEGAAEDAREGEQVVDLVGEVGPAGGQDAAVRQRLGRLHLRVGVGH